MKRGSLIITDSVLMLSIVFFLAGGQHTATVQSLASVAAIVLLSAGSLIQHYTHYRLTQKLY